MQEYTEFLKDYLDSENRRNINKNVFILLRGIYRGIANNRFTFEEAERRLKNKRS